MKYLYFCIISLFVFLSINCSTPYQPKKPIEVYKYAMIIDNFHRVELYANQSSKQNVTTDINSSCSYDIRLIELEYQTCENGIFYLPPFFCKHCDTNVH